MAEFQEGRYYSSYWMYTDMLESQIEQRGCECRRLLGTDPGDSFPSHSSIYKNEGVGDRSSALMQSVYRGGLTRVVGVPCLVVVLSHWGGCVQFREKSLFLEG